MDLFPSWSVSLDSLSEESLDGMMYSVLRNGLPSGDV